MLPVILLVAALQAATTPAPRVPRAAISGRITEKDTNRPIPRAVVSLQRKGAADARQTITDADGRYAFEDVEPGEYALWAGPGELIETHLDQAYGEPSVLVRGAPPAARLAVKSGAILTGIDIALPRALAIEGRVLDPWDDPVAEAEVSVARLDRSPVFVMPSYSDDRGEYRVFGLAPGRYRVCAAPGGSFPSFSDTGSKAVRTCHLAAVLESNAADVLLEDTDASGIDIRMQRTGTYSASGTVLDSDGVPAGGAQVWASREDQGSGAHATAPDGQFTLPGLTPGRYRVQASIGGRMTPDDPRPPAREREWGYTPMDIDSGDLSNVVVTVAKPQRVAGRVVFEEPPPRGSLHMTVEMGIADDMWQDHPPIGAVDDRLAFEVGDLYRVPAIVHMQGLPDGWIVRAVIYDGRDITDRPVDFGAPADGRRLEIRLTNRVARPRVRVTNEDGRPAAPYAVVIIPSDPARSSAVRLGTSRPFVEDNPLTLDPILPGEYLIAALPSEDMFVLFRERERIESLRASARRITIAEHDDAVIEVRMSRLPSSRQ